MPRRATLEVDLPALDVSIAPRRFDALLKDRYTPSSTVLTASAYFCSSIFRFACVTAAGRTGAEFRLDAAGLRCRGADRDIPPGHAHDLAGDAIGLMLQRVIVGAELELGLHREAWRQNWLPSAVGKDRDFAEIP